MEAVLDDETAVEYISANVKRLLEEQGISQSELARRSDNQRMFISDIVNGNHSPKLGPLSRVAEALGVRVDDLLSAPKRRALTSRNR